MTDSSKDVDWAKADEEWIRSCRSEPLDKAWFRMPVGFGRAPGPRNFPEGKAEFLNRNERTMYRVDAHTDGDLLSELLPPGVEVLGEPTIRLSVLTFKNTNWLAGRPYSALQVTTPATSHRGAEPLEGRYTLVAWHTVPDNVITAREELGWPHLWANVCYPISRGPNAFSGYGSWFDFKFAEFELFDLTENPDPAPEPPEVSLLYKYVPVGYTEGSDTSRFVVNELRTYWKDSGLVPGLRPPSENLRRTTLEGNGTFHFNEPRFEDMPTQYHIVKRLAEFPLRDFHRAAVLIDALP